MKASQAIDNAGYGGGEGPQYIFVAGGSSPWWVSNPPNDKTAWGHKRRVCYSMSDGN